MARIARETVEMIRDRTDVVEIVSRHVKLQRRGRSWVGLCPFHQEKSPSFHVIPDKSMYHCFGCQASGDVFRFLMELEGLGFVEAVKELAGPAGITIEERELTRVEREQLRDRATLYDVLEEAAAFFEAQLWTSPEAEVARSYLQRRAMTQELCRTARVGWAPAGWSKLIDHLHAKGFRPELAVDAGLAKVRERGNGHYDAFRERVIIPIRDDRSRVIAFGGRILQGDGPKYINSPETKLYQKSHVLYGFDAARRAVGQQDRLILVEGYFDVLSMHQAGFLETAATCGTALTEEHVQKIRRLTRNVIVLLDADEAGARAAERTLPMFDAHGIQAWRLQLPDAKDPDDLIREGGAEAMEAALAHKEPLLAWVAERKMLAYGYTAAGKARARDELAESMGGLSATQVAELAPILRIEEREFLDWARAYRAPRPQQADAPPPIVDDAAPSWKPTRDLVHLLWLLVNRYGEVADLLRRADPHLLGEHGPIQPVVARLLQGESVASVLDDEPDAGVRRTLTAVVARDALYSPEEAPSALVEVLVRIARPRDEAKAAALHAEAVRLARAGRSDEARGRLEAYDAIQQRARAMERALERASGQLDPAKRTPHLLDCLDLLAPPMVQAGEE